MSVKWQPSLVYALVSNTIDWAFTSHAMLIMVDAVPPPAQAEPPVMVYVRPLHGAAADVTDHVPVDASPKLVPEPGQLDAPSDDAHSHTPGTLAHPRTAVSTEHTLTPRSSPDDAENVSDGATNDATSYVYPFTTSGEAQAAATGAVAPPVQERLTGHAAQERSSAEPAAQ